LTQLNSYKSSPDKEIDEEKHREPVEPFKLMPPMEQPKEDEEILKIHFDQEEEEEKVVDDGFVVVEHDG
jgi:hypothetical protein